MPDPGHFTELLNPFIAQNHPKSNEFLLQIRNYNSTLAFVSMEVHIITVPGRWPKVFKLDEHIYPNTYAVRLKDETVVSK
jgi:hypothetical protein